MKIFFIMTIFYIAIFADGDNSFITKDEYAKMLYENPRGISCAKCHGKNGEGIIISTYKDKKGRKIELRTLNLKNLKLKEFKDGFKKTDSIMPKYYLTDEEIELLYYFIKNEKGDE